MRNKVKIFGLVLVSVMVLIEVVIPTASGCWNYLLVRGGAGPSMRGGWML